MPSCGGSDICRDAATDLYGLHVVIQSLFFPDLSFVNGCRTKVRCLNRAIKLTSGRWIAPNLLGTTWTKTSHLEVDFGGPSDHAETEGRRVKSPITFSKDEKVILYKTGELGEETQQGPVIIIGDLKEQHKQRWAGLTFQNVRLKVTYLVIIGGVISVIRVGVAHSCRRL